MKVEDLGLADWTEYVNIKVRIHKIRQNLTSCWCLAVPSERPALRQKSSSPPHPGVLPDTPAGPEEANGKNFKSISLCNKAKKMKLEKEDTDGLDYDHEEMSRLYFQIYLKQMENTLWKQSFSHKSTLRLAFLWHIYQLVAVETQAGLGIFMITSVTCLSSAI